MPPPPPEPARPGPRPPAEVFHDVHAGLPRHSPGSAETLRALLDVAAPLPAGPVVVDLGCGAGASSVQLADALGAAVVVAVDLHEPFLRRVAAAAGPRPVFPVRATIAAPPVADGTADLLWCDGAAYVIGLDAALATWVRLLRPGGVLVFTDAVWTTAEPAPAARDFWAAAYPPMREVAAVAAAARRAGWEVAGTRLLPGSDWDAYYGPLAASVARVRAACPADGPALDEIAAEIAVRRAHAGDYGYAGFVLRRPR